MSCPDCFKGFIHDYAEPAGDFQDLHGIRTYIAGRPEQRTSSSTVIFVTDAFGFKLINNQLLADYFVAASGLNVLMPDVVPGGGMPITTLETMEKITAPVKWWDIRGHIARVIATIRVVFTARHIIFGSTRAYSNILAYSRAVKANLPSGGKLGVAGYCWGGLQSTSLSKESAVPGGKEALVDAHYTAHPSGLKVPKDIVESVGKFGVPFSLAIGDQDIMLSTEKVAEIEASLRKEFGDGDADADHPYEIQIYAESGHGFAVRADRRKTVEDEAANRAATQAIDWFKKYLS